MAPATPDPTAADTGLLGGVDEANEDLDAFLDDDARGGAGPERA